jgi:NADP-dependent 3-hydroxy acid dehydrogenase YdfG
VKVIITGASRGIGKGIATFLAMDGCSVGLIARSAKMLGDVCASIREQGGVAFGAACDLRDFEMTQAAVASLAEDLGGVDALINNAGLVLRKSVWDISLDEWRALVDTNISGMFHATKATLQLFKAQGHGHVINISSISGKNPLAGGSAYAATKYAVTGFTQSLLLEVRDMAIKVTAIYPGSVDSASQRHDPATDHSWKVTPEEIGQACAQALRTAPGTVISEIEIRPLRRSPTG